MSDETGTTDPPGERRATALREHVAPHVDRAIMAGRLGSCRSGVLRDDGPHHLAHYDRGVYEFGVDVLDEVARAVEGVEGPDRRREALTEMGRQLSFITTGLDGMLRDAETGRLIRVVLHTEHDAIVCCSVIPREHLIGTVFGHAGGGRDTREWSKVSLVRSADMVVSGLAAELRERIGLPTQNPGGWLARMPADTAPADEPAGSGASDATDAVFAEGAGDAEVMNLCRAALDPRDLMYIAHYERGASAFALDIFQHPRTAANWGHISPDTRREFYGRLYPRFISLASQLGQLARPVMRGRLRRVVLDVEEGAIYYYRLSAGEYLVGTTVNQARVSHADDRMSELAVRCAAVRK